MEPGSKMKFLVKLYNKLMLCIVIPEDSRYYVQLDGADVAIIKLNEYEKWIQLTGRRLPDEFIYEVGLHIESRYKEDLFADN